MIKLRYVLFLILFAFSVFSLFQIKFKVQNLNRELVELKKELEHEKNAIHILKAEWAYLNNPERLQRLTTKFLDLEEIKPKQILLNENEAYLVTQVSNRKDNDVQLVQISYSKKKATKWRYKDRPDLKGK